MEKTKKAIDVPLGHASIRENSQFMNELAEKVHTGEWTRIDDVREFLGFHGYRPDTVNRFVHGVELRLKTKHWQPKKSEVPSGEYPTDEKGNHIHPERKKEKK